jgi:hypothetical protein
MPTKANRDICHELSDIGTNGKTLRIRAAAVFGLYARGRQFKDIKAAHALRYLVDEGEQYIGREALRALRRLVNE